MNENENLEARLADLERQVAEIKNMISAQSNKNFDVSVYENVLSDSDMAYLMNVKDVRQADYEINNILARLRKQGVNANLNDLANFIESKKGTSTKNDDSNVSEKIKELASKLTDYDMKYLLSIENPNQTNFLFSSLNARYGASIDDLIAAAKYKNAHMNDVKLESGVVAEEETPVESDNLLEELDRLDKEYEEALDKGDDVSEINGKRNAVLDAIDKSKVNESDNVSSVVSDNEYPKLESADMNKISQILMNAKIGNNILNQMAEKYGVNKDVFYKMFNLNMLERNFGLKVEKPNKMPEKIESVDSKYKVVPEPSMNDEVKGVYPLTVEEFKENGGLEPDSRGRRFVKKIANSRIIRFLVDKAKEMHMKMKMKKQDEISYESDSSAISEKNYEKIPSKKEKMEAYQKEVEKMKANENEIDENVAVNDEPEITKFNAR